MQNIIDFIINNKIVFISIFILMICVIIGFFGNRRLEAKKNSASSSNDTKENGSLQSDKIIDTDLSSNINNNVLNNEKTMYSINDETASLQTNDSTQYFPENKTTFTDLDNINNNVNYKDQESIPNNLNNSTISSDFYIPDDNNISNIF